MSRDRRNINIAPKITDPDTDRASQEGLQRDQKIKRLKSQTGDRSIGIDTPFAVVGFSGEGAAEVYG